MLPVETTLSLSRAFALEPLEARLEAGESLSLDDVRAYLVDRIAALLDANPALLLSILYRIDVAERDVKEVFSDVAPPEMPGRLADLIIERQVQKMRIRQRFRDEDDTDAG